MECLLRQVHVCTFFCFILIFSAPDLVHIVPPLSLSYFHRLQSVNWSGLMSYLLSMSSAPLAARAFITPGAKACSHEVLKRVSIYEECSKSLAFFCRSFRSLKVILSCAYTGSGSLCSLSKSLLYVFSYFKYVKSNLWIFITGSVCSE